MKVRYLLMASLLVFACQPKEKPTVTEEDPIIDSMLKEKPIIPLEPEEEVEDVLKFMPPIEAQSYFGFEIGQAISERPEDLVAGALSTGEGTFEVQYMRYQNDTLGYVFAPADTIESIHIWDERGATLQGIRPGTTFAELKTFLPQFEVHGSEVEARVHVFFEAHRYRLNYNHSDYNLDSNDIPDDVEVMEVIITPSHP
ncbi:MAG: hypothetical protein KTR13_09750 [Saprospiraceae bacterium]|nr:hypothetical protein [Saprospiraceae bacterium]